MRAAIEMGNTIGAFLLHFVANAVKRTIVPSLIQGSIKCEAVMAVSLNLDACHSVIFQLKLINMDQVNVFVISGVLKKLKLQIVAF
jgi:hypothetical protein